MNRRQFIIYIVDVVILTLSYLLMAAYKPATLNYLSEGYLIAFVVLLVTWTTTSLYFGKYIFKKKHNFSRFLKNLFLPNFISLGIVTVVIVGFQLTYFSRLVLFGTIGMATLVELFIGNLYFLLIHSGTNGVNLINPLPSSAEMKRARQATDYRNHTLSPDVIQNAVESQCGKGSFMFMEKFLDVNDKRTMFISTTTRFNIEFQPDNFYDSIVNLRRINDIQYINKFLESVNRKLPVKGLFLGCAETKSSRKKRILAKFPPVLNWLFYSIDFLFKRIFPKFILTKKIYFLFTRGMNRVLSKAEILGRLYSCGFEVVDDTVIGNLFFFVARKAKVPAYDFNPTYGPFVKLRRIGKGGEFIRVYKFRTMHPFAEYLQDYLYKRNNLENGGKFKNDFRVSTLGRFLRKFWLDELPMLINLLKGEMKLVGVRPLSKQYFDLYSEELRQKRILYKPGLIPPFYADLPETMEEIQASEMKYLEAFEKHPWKTDWKYFWKAIVNILFKKARSS